MLDLNPNHYLIDGHNFFPAMIVCYLAIVLGLLLVAAYHALQENRMSGLLNATYACILYLIATPMHYEFFTALATNFLIIGLSCGLGAVSGAIYDFAGPNAAIHRKVTDNDVQGPSGSS